MAGPSSSTAPTLWDRVQRALRPSTLAADPTQVASAGRAVDATIASAGGLTGLASGFLDEVHDQEERLATFIRWGTVALVAIVVLGVVLTLAWFFAPARTLAARAVG